MDADVNMGGGVSDDEEDGVCDAFVLALFVMRGTGSGAARGELTGSDADADTPLARACA